jgi:phage terminase large subunit-like protein
MSRPLAVGQRDVGFDPWNSRQISVELVDEGFNCVEVGQGFQKISEPTKKLPELVICGKCWHAGHEVLRWKRRLPVVEE